MSSIVHTVRAFTALHGALNQHKRSLDNQPVHVVSCGPLQREAAYHGYGLAVMDGAARPDQVAVMLENGNTWYYPIENVQLVAKGSRQNLPLWLKRLLRSRAAKRARFEKNGHRNPNLTP